MWRYQLRHVTSDIWSYKNTAQDDLNRLHEWIQQLVHDSHWEPCDYGKSTPTTTAAASDGCTDEREVDIDVRNCHRASVALWVNSWLLDNTVKDMLTSAVRADTDSVDIRNTEVLRYGVGCHFEEHVDRVRGADHIGTLLFVVPSEDLEGGDLVIRDAEDQPPTGASPYIVFIPLNVPHSVTLVTKGLRYVAKASVHARLLKPREKLKAVSRLRD
jgi:predicted 2-oxoglutarate/Fe(II)-dependent dioxygenase YbiX